MTQDVSELSRKKKKHGGRTVKLNLNDPVDARRFFREYRTDEGELLEWIQAPNTSRINIFTANDMEVCYWANFIWDHHFSKGLGFMVETEIH